jgi:DNA-damage-inducible protein J
MSDSVVRARVNADIKAAAKANAQALGMDLSTVIRMVINRLATTGELPADLLKPNQKTLQAITDLERDVGVKRVNTVGDLKHDLGW